MAPKPNKIDLEIKPMGETSSPGKPKPYYPTVSVPYALEAGDGPQRFTIEAQVVGVRKPIDGKPSTELAIMSICPCEEDEGGDAGDKLGRAMEKIAKGKMKKPETDEEDDE